MSKNEKKRQESKENLKRLKSKLNKMTEDKKEKENPQPCLLSFICKLFRKTN